MGIDALAKRYAPLFICLLLAVAAYFQASGLTQLLGLAVAAGSPPPPERHGDAHLALRAAPRETSAQAILDRNPFDSVTGPLTAREMPAPGAAAPAQSADWYDAPPCDVARAVLITTADDPDWSFAAITGPDGKTVLRRRGEDFFGGKVEFIGDHRPAEQRHQGEHGMWDRVWLTAPNGMRCQLQLGAKPPAKMAGAMPPGAAPSALPPGVNGKIRKIGDHEFDVDRSAIDALIANPADLMKTRVVPEKEGDRVVGLKLYGIRPNTLLGQIGLQNGDRLQSINGFEMNDPQKMLEAYSKLMRADRISASVIRNGQPVTLDFNIK
jgi:general secretion pathway protein C